MAYAYLLDPGIAQNAGIDLTAFRQDARRDDCLGQAGAPVTLCTSHSQEIIEAIVDALAPACPGARWQVGENGLGSPSKAKTRGTVSRLFGTCFMRVQAPAHRRAVTDGTAAANGIRPVD